MRTVSYKLADLSKVVIHLGKMAENDATQVRIDAAEVFSEYPNAVPALDVINPTGEAYTVEVTLDGSVVVWNVKDSSLTAEGQGEIQLTFTQNGTKVKSSICRTQICRSISGGGTPPDPVQDWLDHANEVLEEVEDAFPEGGTTGQVLAKKSDADFDTEWVDQGSGGTTDYTELTNKPQIGGVTLTGNKSLSDLGAASAADVSEKYTKPAGGIPASDLAAGVIPDPEELIDDESTAANKVLSAQKVSGELADVKSAFDTEPVNENIYDEVNNSAVQSDPQYTIGTVYLNGYTGSIVVSCDSNKASYITDLHVYNASEEDMGVSFGTTVYNLYQNRSGKPATIPSGATKIEFKYRTAYSGGALVEKVMVSKGNTVPEVYCTYIKGDVFKQSPYLKKKDCNAVAFVSLSGNDNNDGLTFDTAVATFQKALSISNIIVAERGEYNQKIISKKQNGITLLAYSEGINYSHTYPKLAKVSVKGSMFINCDNLHIEDYKFEGTGVSSLYIDECNKVDIYNCEANNSTTSMGFEVIDSNVVFYDCYATGNKYDGFNFHGYGVSIMNNCISEDNDDDGCSHHDGCIGFINGGRFNENVKAGIAPAYGANVDINNVICKNNSIGIGYLSTNNGHANMKGTINSCALVGNVEGLTVNALCSVVAINCVYSENTTDKNVTGTLTEY